VPAAKERSCPFDKNVLHLTIGRAAMAPLKEARMMRQMTPTGFPLAKMDGSDGCVMLAVLDAAWAGKHADGVAPAEAKLKEFDFVDVVGAPDQKRC